MDDSITIEFNRKDLTINMQEVVGTIIKYYYIIAWFEYNI